MENWLHLWSDQLLSVSLLPVGDKHENLTEGDKGEHLKWLPSAAAISVKVQGNES